MVFTAPFAALLALVLALAPSSTRAQGDGPACARTYEVQPGDWCDKISAEQNSSTYQLLAANVGLIDPSCSNLFPGEIICLGRVGQDCNDVVVVEAGSSCTAIATAATITVDKLLANNPNVNAQCTNIYPGEVLCVQA